MTGLIRQFMMKQKSGRGRLIIIIKYTFFKKIASSHLKPF